VAFSLVSCSLGSVVLCAAMFECGIFVVLGVVVAIFSIIGDVLRGAGVCFIRHFFLSFGGRLACAWLTDSRGVATLVEGLGEVFILQGLAFPRRRDVPWVFIIILTSHSCYSRVENYSKN